MYVQQSLSNTNTFAHFIQVQDTWTPHTLKLKQMEVYIYFSVEQCKYINSIIIKQSPDYSVFSGTSTYTGYEVRENKIIKKFEELNKIFKRTSSFVTMRIS